MKRSTIIIRKILVLSPFALFCIMGFMLVYNLGLSLPAGGHLSSGQSALRSARIGIVSIYIIRLVLILNLLSIIKGLVDKRKRSIPVFNNFVGMILFFLCLIATILMFYTDWLNFTAFTQMLFVRRSLSFVVDWRSLPILLFLLIIVFGFWDIQKAKKPMECEAKCKGEMMQK